jgi:DNA-directed RNA polymerase specialized sigma24 family protein
MNASPENPLSETISGWLSQIKRGDRDGVEPIVSRYLRRLSALAAARLRGRPELDGMEEDVALSALKSLCLGAEEGRFPQLDDRDDLWRLLACMTVRKSVDLMRKRNHGQAMDERECERLLSEEPTPAEVAEVTEHIQVILSKLQDPTLQKIAVWKVEGYSNREIAERLQTVERLHRIRLLWKDEIQRSNDF